MSCEACRDALEADGYEPECFSGSCRIPEPDGGLQRILEIHARIRGLQNLVDGAAVLRMYDADLLDLELLMVIEEMERELHGENEEYGGGKQKDY